MSYRKRQHKGAKLGLEDEFFKMFKHFDMFGKGKAADSAMNAMIMSMLKTVELDMLRRIRSRIDETIRTTEQQQSTSWRTEGIPFGSTMGQDNLDPFDILGVDMDATYEEVKKAYRKKAAKAHPDAGGSHEEMVKVNAAWEAIHIIKGWGR